MGTSSDGRLELLTPSLENRHSIMRVYFFLIFLISSFIGSSQSSENWNILSMVVKERAFDEMMGMEVIKAVPMSPVLDYDGKEIELSGYMIALSAKIEEQSHFMFSRYPQNMCFFCGAAGPESAMQVFMKEGTKILHQKEKIKIKGTLQIQENDASGLIYFLNSSEIIKD